MAIMKFNPRTAMRLFGLVVATAALSWHASDAPDLAVVDGLRLSLLIRNPSQTTAGKLKTETEKVTAISESDTEIEQKVRKALKEWGFTVTTDDQWPRIEKIKDKYEEVYPEYTQGKKKEESFLDKFYWYNYLLDHYEDFYRKKMLPEQPSAGPASDAEAALEAYKEALLKFNEAWKKLRDMDISVEEYWAAHMDLSNKLTTVQDKFRNGLSEAEKSKCLTILNNLGQGAEEQDNLQTKEKLLSGHSGITFSSHNLENREWEAVDSDPAHEDSVRKGLTKSIWPSIQRKLRALAA